MLGGKLVEWAVDTLNTALLGAKVGLVSAAGSVPFVGGVLTALANSAKIALGAVIERIPAAGAAREAIQGIVGDVVSVIENPSAFVSAYFQAGAVKTAAVLKKLIGVAKGFFVALDPVALVLSEVSAGPERELLRATLSETLGLLENFGAPPADVKTLLCKFNPALKKFATDRLVPLAKGTGLEALVGTVGASASVANTAGLLVEGFFGKQADAKDGPLCGGPSWFTSLGDAATRRRGDAEPRCGRGAEYVQGDH